MLHGYGVKIVDRFGHEIPGKRNGEGAWIVPFPNTRDNSEYKIRLINNHPTRCDAFLTVDDKFMGKFRLNAFDSWSIERPSQDQRKFEFHAETSRVAREAGVTPGRFTNGLVSVEFMPEKSRHQHPRWVSAKLPFLTETASEPLLEESLVPSTEPREEFSSIKFSSAQPLSLPQAESYISHAGERAMTMKRAKKMAMPKHHSYSSGATILGGPSHQKFRDVLPLNYDDDQRVTITLRLVVDHSKSNSGLPTRRFASPFRTLIPSRPEDTPDYYSVSHLW